MSKTPMVRVLARGLAAASQFALCAHPTRRLWRGRIPASLLRTFQPHPGDALCCDYSGLRPIYATQSHPKMLTLAHIQSLSGAKLRIGSESPNARGFYFLAACCSTKFFDEPKFQTFSASLRETFN